MILLFVEAEFNTVTLHTVDIAQVFHFLLSCGIHQHGTIAHTRLTERQIRELRRDNKKRSNTAFISVNVS